MIGQDGWILASFVFFCIFMDQDEVNDQYPAVLSSCIVNNAYVSGGGGGEGDQILSDGDDGIGAKIKTPKNSQSEFPGRVLLRIKYNPTCFAVVLTFNALHCICFIKTVIKSFLKYFKAEIRDSDCIECPKNPYLNQATQKNTWQFFLPKKLPESKISNPKKSFHQPRHLKSGVPPPPRDMYIQSNLPK